MAESSSSHRSGSSPAKEANCFLGVLKDVKPRLGMDSVRHRGAGSPSPGRSDRTVMAFERWNDEGEHGEEVEQEDEEDEEDERRGASSRNFQGAAHGCDQNRAAVERAAPGMGSKKRGAVGKAVMEGRRASWQENHGAARRGSGSSDSSNATSDDDSDDIDGDVIDGGGARMEPDGRGRRRGAFQQQQQCHLQQQQKQQRHPQQQVSGDEPGLRDRAGANASSGLGLLTKLEPGNLTTVVRQCVAPAGVSASVVAATAVVVLALVALLFLPGTRPPAGPPGAGVPAEPAYSAAFSERLSAARRRFPSQCAELWRRVNITLRRHLAELEAGDPGAPAQPATLLLASGPRGLRAAEALAHGLADAYAHAVAAASDSAGRAPPVETLSGADLSALSGDDAKLEVDSRLQAALGGGGGAHAAVAVLLRMERLPPASTLMLYAYCDHATARFKRALLVFTVLLDGGDGGAEAGDGGAEAGDGAEAGEESCRALSGFADRVHGSLRRALVGPVLDLDKFAGLWSRVATVVLPVRPEGGVLPSA